MRTTRTVLVGLGLAAVAITAACGTGSDTSTGDGGDGSGPRIALLLASQANTASIAVSEGVQEIADAEGAEVEVFDATFDAQRQFAQMQDVITTGKYDGILVQPLDGSGICSLVPLASDAGIAVGAVNSAIGVDFTTAESSCEGVSVSVVRPFADHGTALGELTVQACEEAGASPCPVGYLRVAPGAPFDEAISDAFEAAVAAADVEVVAEANSEASREGGFRVIQQMLTAHPDIEVLVGPEQSLLGGEQPIEAAGLDHELRLVGIGGTTQGIEGVASGKLFGTSFSAPRSEGERAMQDLLESIETSEPQAAVDIVGEEFDGGLVTRETAGEFTPEFDS